MNRNLSSTRFDRVFINLELLSRIIAIRMERTDPIKYHLAQHISKTIYPDGRLVQYYPSYY